MFGFGIGEIVALGIIVLAVVGARHLPDLSELLGRWVVRNQLPVASGRDPWTWGDWLLVAATIVMAATVLCLAVGTRG